MLKTDVYDIIFRGKFFLMWNAECKNLIIYF